MGRLIRAATTALLLWLASLPTQADPYLSAGAHYPVPPSTPQRLFYLQRSTNANTVVYDAHLDADGRPDPSQPIEVYWLRYNTTGQRRELGFWERLLAYGVHAVRRDRGYEFWLNAAPERKVHLSLDATGHPRATLDIAGQLARLRKVYVAVDDNGLWPTIHYIMLYGKSLANGRPLSERIDP